MDLSADPTWNALAAELDSLASASGAENAIVADETSLLWCRARAMTPLDTERAFSRLAMALGPDGGRDLARGHKLRYAAADVPPYTYAESFAGIYVLLLWFTEPFVEFRVHGLVHRALPEIERLTVALPPPDGPDSTAGEARKRALGRRSPRSIRARRSTAALAP